MKWEKVKLINCCNSLTDGDHQAPPKSSDGVPFVTISNIINNQFDFDNTMFVPYEYYENLDEKRKPRKNDILYSVVGSYGIPVLIKNNSPFVFQRHIAILKPKEEVNAKFLYYTMLSNEFYVKADNVALGAAQRTISLTALRNIEINVPDIEVQHKIANILSAYDDLIENNQKQIKLLEEAAQRLYKEWFVDLRFPGYENAPIIDGVPEGWSMVKVGEVIKYEIGGGWGEETIDEKFDNPAYVIRGTDLYGLTHGDFNDIPYRFHSDSNLKARKLIDGDIIFEISGGSKNEGVARTALIRSNLLKIFSEPVMCASFCKLVRFDSLEIAQYMYDTFKYLRECGKTSEFDKKSASSIVNYRWKDFLMQQLILLPNEKILTNYNRLAINLYNQILCKSILIAKLVEARDKLLPKLMSGEIEV